MWIYKFSKYSIINVYIYIYIYIFFFLIIIIFVLDWHWRFLFTNGDKILYVVVFHNIGMPYWVIWDSNWKTSITIKTFYFQTEWYIYIFFFNNNKNLWKMFSYFMFIIIYFNDQMRWNIIILIMEIRTKVLNTL